MRKRMPSLFPYLLTPAAPAGTGPTLTGTGPVPPSLPKRRSELKGYASGMQGPASQNATGDELGSFLPSNETGRSVTQVDF